MGLFKILNDNGTTIILTTHYLEEAENLCKVWRSLMTVEFRKCKHERFLEPIKNETFIIYTETKVENKLPGEDSKIIDDNTIEISISSGTDINSLVQQLSERESN